MSRCFRGIFIPHSISYHGQKQECPGSGEALDACIRWAASSEYYREPQVVFVELAVEIWAKDDSTLCGVFRCQAQYAIDVTIILIHRKPAVTGEEIPTITDPIGYLQSKRSSYAGDFRDPHSFPMGLLGISRVILICVYIIPYKTCTPLGCALVCSACIFETWPLFTKW